MWDKECGMKLDRKMDEKYEQKYRLMTAFTMGHREWCLCCGKQVTQSTLTKHADKAARQQHIAMMGIDG